MPDNNLSSLSPFEGRPIVLRTVPASMGLWWLKRGWALLKIHPWDSHMAVLFFLGALSICALLPWIGSFIAVALMPVLYLGVMAVFSHNAGQHIGASQNTKPNKAQPQTVFVPLIAAFKAPQTLRQLIILGFVYGAAVFAMIGLYALIDGGTAFNYVVLGDPLPKEIEDRAKAVVAMAGVLVFYAPISMAFWFTQQLVGWHGQSVAKSIFFSWIACWRNLGAFSVFGIAWVCVYLFTSGLLVLITLLLGMPTLLPVLIFPLSVFLMVWTFACFYASYESLVQPLPPIEASD